MNRRNDMTPLPGWQEINRRARLEERRLALIGPALYGEEAPRLPRRKGIRRLAIALVQALAAALSWM